VIAAQVRFLKKPQKKENKTPKMIWMPPGAPKRIKTSSTSQQILNSSSPAPHNEMECWKKDLAAANHHPNLPLTPSYEIQEREDKEGKVQASQ